MKAGDILLNKSAGENNPEKYSMYIGMDKKYIKTLYMDIKTGKIKIKRFYRNAGFLELVGHSNGFDMLKKEIRGLNKN